MAIISFEGPQGYGKTLSAVALCWIENQDNKKRIICNNHLNFDYTHFDLEFFVSNIASNEMENCVLFLDEAYQYLDCRLSQSKMTRLFTYFIVQTRKREVDFYFTTHSLENVDVRLRKAVDIRGACNYEKEKPCKTQKYR